jgi:hypothetical protein
MRTSVRARLMKCEAFDKTATGTTRPQRNRRNVFTSVCAVRSCVRVCTRHHNRVDLCSLRRDVAAVVHLCPEKLEQTNDHGSDSTVNSRRTTTLLVCDLSSNTKGGPTGFGSGSTRTIRIVYAKFFVLGKDRYDLTGP